MAAAAGTTRRRLPVETMPGSRRVHPAPQELDTARPAHPALPARVQQGDRSRHRPGHGACRSPGAAGPGHGSVSGHRRWGGGCAVRAPGALCCRVFCRPAATLTPLDPHPPTVQHAGMRVLPYLAISIFMPLPPVPMLLMSAGECLRPPPRCSPARTRGVRCWACPAAAASFRRNNHASMPHLHLPPEQLPQR